MSIKLKEKDMYVVPDQWNDFGVRERAWKDGRMYQRYFGAASMRLATLIASDCNERAREERTGELYIAGLAMDNELSAKYSRFVARTDIAAVYVGYRKRGA